MIIDRNVLVRYFLGECSEDEKENIHQWLESSEANKEEFIRERIRFDASLVIDEEELLSLTQSVRPNKSWMFIRIAAVVLFLIGSSYLFQLFLFEPPTPNLQTVFVPAGSRTLITLPDGTSVWLNSNSSFTYPNIFTGKHRVVDLDGEGYFDVAGDDKKNFIVKTDKYNIEVLGTKFNLEAYTAEADFKTSLYSGKVRIYKEEYEEESIRLIPGQAVELDGNRLKVVSASNNSYRWKDGLIILEGQSFEEIMHIFEKYFDFKVIINNEKAMQMGYEGKLRIVDGIDHALRVLQNDFRFTYRREEETNIIHIY